MGLHRLRGVHLEHRQNVMDDPAHGQAERNAALLYGTLGIQDAAGVVEAVVGRRHINAVAGGWLLYTSDAAGERTSGELGGPRLSQKNKR